MSLSCSNCGMGTNKVCKKTKNPYCSKACQIEHKPIASMMPQAEPIGHHMAEPEKNKIVASGEHTVRSAPDTASVTFRVTAQYNEVRDTEGAVRLKYSRAIQERVIGKYPQLVVEKTSYEVRPVMVYPKDQRPRRVGFKATQSITVSTQDLGLIGIVIQDATREREDDISFDPSDEGRPVVLVDGVDFYLKDSEKAEMEALVKATEHARKKIQVMAEAAGVSSWTISRISEDGYSRPRTIHYESARALSDAPSSQEEPSTILSPGVIETRKTVRMEALI